MNFFSNSNGWNINSIFYFHLYVLNHFPFYSVAYLINASFTRLALWWVKCIFTITIIIMINNKYNNWIIYCSRIIHHLTNYSDSSKHGHLIPNLSRQSTGEQIQQQIKILLFYGKRLIFNDSFIFFFFMDTHVKLDGKLVGQAPTDVEVYLCSNDEYYCNGSRNLPFMQSGRLWYENDGRQSQQGKQS